MSSARGPIEAAQLQNVLPGTAAEIVNNCCEMAPGVPWSNLVLDDMLKTLKDAGALRNEKRDTPGFYSVESSILFETKTIKKVETFQLRACVCWYKTKEDWNPHPEYRYRLPVYASQTWHPYTRAGLKAAILKVQEVTQDVVRRGPCEECPPRKRLRVGNSGVCGECLFKRCLA